MTLLQEELFIPSSIKKKKHIFFALHELQTAADRNDNSCWNLCFICNTCLILFQWLSEIPKNLVLFCKFLLWIWCLFHLLLRSIITLETRICPPKWLPLLRTWCEVYTLHFNGAVLRWILASSARWDLNVAPEFSQLGPLQGPYQARVKIWYNFQGCNSVWRQEAPYKVICKVTLSFTPYSLFCWYPQSKEILLNLNMKC
jgi:hypothetical protein